MKNCGKCAISLTCHTGNIYRMSVCPQCNVLKIILTKNITRPRYYTQCPLRLLSKDTRKAWFKQFMDKEHHLRNIAAVYDMYSDEAKNPMSRILAIALRTTVYITDTGPPQKEYINRKGILPLPVTLCDHCLKKLENETPGEVIEKLQQMHD